VCKYRCGDGSWSPAGQPYGRTRRLRSSSAPRDRGFQGGGREGSRGAAVVSTWQTASPRRHELRHWARNHAEVSRPPPARAREHGQGLPMLMKRKRKWPDGWNLSTPGRSRPRRPLLASFAEAKIRWSSRPRRVARSQTSAGRVSGRPPRRTIEAWVNPGVDIARRCRPASRSLRVDAAAASGVRHDLAYSSVLVLSAAGSGESTLPRETPLSSSAKARERRAAPAPPEFARSAARRLRPGLRRRAGGTSLRGRSTGAVGHVGASGASHMRYMVFSRRLGRAPSRNQARGTRRWLPRRRSR